MNLIPRFYDVTEGSIRIDGKDIRTVTQHELREKIGYVPQKGMSVSYTHLLVGHQIDVKPCPEKEHSQMVFISKIGPAAIRKIMSAWEEEVGLPMKLRN